MLIKLYFSSASPDGVRLSGSVVRVDDEEGKRMIKERVGRLAAPGEKETPIRKADPSRMEIEGPDDRPKVAAPQPAPEPYMDEVVRRRAAK